MSVLYRDDEIELPLERFPKQLIDELKRLDAEYDKGEDNWYAFTKALEDVEIDAKTYCIDNKITDKELDSIYRKYGLR